MRSDLSMMLFVLPFLWQYFELRPLPGPAKRGRPRIRWPVFVLDKCVRSVGSYDQLLEYWDSNRSSFAAWKAHVRKAIF